MRIRMIGAYLIVSLAVMLVLMSTTPVAMAIPGKLWLNTISEGTYIYDGDAWLCESTVTADTSFNLTIYYHHGVDICYLYLLVAVDRDPADNVTVNVNGSNVSLYDGVITTNNKANVTETDPDYEYPGHGIYIYGSSVHFEVVNITDQIPGDGPLSAGENITVPVEITLPTSPSVPVKVHFDAVGADCITGEAIAFVPPSHDVTHQVPEFSTIAIPVAAILGLLFFFNHRKRKKS